MYAAARQQQLVDQYGQECSELQYCEARMLEYAAMLREDLRRKTNPNLVAELNLQTLRDAEWKANHPQRDRSTQVHEFQLPSPPSMTLPIVVRETPPASPE